MHAVLDTRRRYKRRPSLVVHRLKVKNTGFQLPARLAPVDVVLVIKTERIVMRNPNDWRGWSEEVPDAVPLGTVNDRAVAATASICSRSHDSCNTRPKSFIKWDSCAITRPRYRLFTSPSWRGPTLALGRLPPGRSLPGTGRCQCGLDNPGKLDTWIKFLKSPDHSVDAARDCMCINDKYDWRF